jgi:hypothetical protein
MDVLNHGVQLSGPAVDGDLPGPLSVQLVSRQERRESNTRAGRREHQGRRPDDLRLDLTIGKDVFMRSFFLLRVACLLQRDAPVRNSSALRCCRDGG